MTTPAPHRSSLMSVKPEWIDFNGHLNMAYYNVLFDNGAEEIFTELGFGADYRARTGFTTFSAEYHVCYLRELHVDQKVYVTAQLLDFDEKRLHFFQELRHEDGWLSATGEGVTLHIDSSGPRVAPMPTEHYERVAALHKLHAQMPRPARAGRSISLKKR